MTRISSILVLVFFSASGALGGEQIPSRTLLDPPTQVAAFADLEGVLFGAPQRLRGTPDGGFLVADWGEFTIRAFDAEGQPTWVAGGAGQGPGEFLGFWDVEYDATGELLVLDARTGRLTVLDSTGALLSTHSLPGRGRPAEVMPSEWVSGTRTVMPADKSAGIWYALGEGGRIRGNGPRLLENLPNPMASEAFATPLADGGAAVVFRWSDWIVFLGPAGEIRRTVNGIEPMPFPSVVTTDLAALTQPIFRGMRGTMTRIDPGAGTAVYSVTADASRLFILFGGKTENARRIVDTYAVSDGSYQGSYLLPHAVRDIALLADGRLATLETDFVPTVRLWHIPPREPRR